MPSFTPRKALTPRGLARRRAGSTIDGARSPPSRRASRRSAATNATRSSFRHRQPAQPRLPARHGGPRRTSRRATDSFWTWRDMMYRFALTMTPDDVEAVAAQLYVEMLEAGFAAVGEFHYLHHAPDGRPTPRAEMASRIVAAARRDRHRADAAAGVLRSCEFRRRAAGAEQRRFVYDLDCSPAFSTMPRAGEGRPSGARRRRAAQPARRDAEELTAPSALARDGPIHIHAAEQINEVEDCLAWSGARPVRWLLDHARSTALVSDPRDAHGRGGNAALARVGAVAGLCPVTEANLGDGVFKRRISSPMAGASGSAPIPTCSSASPTNCGSSNMRSGCAIARATSAPRRAARPDARCSTRPRPAARGRWRAAAGVWRPARAPISSRSRRPSFARRAQRRQILDAWISATAIRCRLPLGGGRKVVADGRHADRERSRRDSPRRCGGYARDERVEAPGNLATRSTPAVRRRRSERNRKGWTSRS